MLRPRLEDVDLGAASGLQFVATGGSLTVPVRANAAVGRLVLFTTKGAGKLWNFSFRPDDRLLFGRESAGVPDDVHDAAECRVRIPIREGMRSLNVTVSAGIALAEASRQLDLTG